MGVGQTRTNPWRVKRYNLLAKFEEITAFHCAALQATPEAWHQMWECAKEKFTKQELYYKMLLAKDSMGRIAWNKAAVECHIEILETLWEWAKGELIPGELKNNMLLGKDYK